MVCPPPARDLVRDALRAIVTVHLPRSAALGEQPLEHPDDIARRERPGAVNGQPFAGVLLQDGQACQPPPISGPVVDNIVAPDMVGRRGPGRHRRVRPDGVPLARWLDHVEPLALQGDAPVRDAQATVRPSAGPTSCESRTGASAPRGHEYGRPTPPAPVDMAADAWSGEARTAPGGRAVRSPRASAPAPPPGAWPPGSPLFSWHVLQHPMVPGEFADLSTGYDAMGDRASVSELALVTDR